MLCISLKHHCSNAECDLQTVACYNTSSMEPTSLIRDKIDLVSFIGEFVVLKKAGRNFKGLCPFHNESTPSFMVSPDRQIWHCFGCAKGGDCFTFLMEYERMEFPEALRTLAAKTGVELPKTRGSKEAISKKEKLYEINKVAAELYHYLLIKHKVGEKARKYLVERGVSEKVIETFRLGFAPNNGTTLSEYMMKKRQYTKDDLLEAGLATFYRSTTQDFFRGRVIFPLYDHRDNVVGFAGRVLEATNEMKAKYINTRDTLIYHKGEMVYGLNMTKDAIRKTDHAVLVEGEFDVLSCFQHGIGNVVAIKGTALTEAQVALLARYAQKITICFDGDSAGQNALLRSLPILEKKGVTTTVILIPNGKDPDEALKASEATFKKAVDHDIPVYDYLLMQLVKKHDPTSMEGKKEITSVLLPLLGNITNEIVKEHYLRKVSSQIEISFESLQKELQKLARKEPTVVDKVTKREKKSREEILEEYLLGLILQYDNPAFAIQEVVSILAHIMPKERAYQKLFSHLAGYFKEHEVFDGRQFSTGLPEALHASYSVCLLLPLPAFSKTEEQLQEIKKITAQLKDIYLRQRLKEVSSKIKKMEEEGKEDDIESIRSTFSTLVSELKK